MRVRPPSGWIVPTLFGVGALASSVVTAQTIAQTLSHPSARTTLVAIYAILRMVVAVAFALFTVGRAAPRRPAREPLAFAACTVAMGSAVMFRSPASGTPEAFLVGGEVVAVVASVWIVVALLRLGHCFGVLPEARDLVRTGPYALVRHPLYAGEILSCAGLTLASPRLVNGLLLLTLVGAQGVRMRLEERALGSAFPEYQRYAHDVPRIIPSLSRLCAARSRAHLSRTTAPATTISLPEADAPTRA